MRVATAFSPGHITGLFQVFRHEDVLHTGSRGAGFSIDRGARSRVTLQEGRGRCSVRIDGAPSPAPVTKRAVRHLLGPEPLDVRVETELQLPVSQGFGMSAAGVLSTCLALVELLGRDEEEAYRAAHRAEVESGSGLGDVAAIRCGGIELRRHEGMAPYGQVERIAGGFDLVLAQVGPRIRTANVILDPEKVRRIDQAGRECLSHLLPGSEIGSLFHLSRRFAEGSGLLSARVRRALQAISDRGQGSMCMIGNSVFATGLDLAVIETALRPLGRTWRASVDQVGPRLL